MNGDNQGALSGIKNNYNYDQQSFSDCSAVGSDYEIQRLRKELEASRIAPKPSMGIKLSKVAEIFEMDIIDEEEALKACKVIIQQHAKVRDKTGPGVTNNTQRIDN